MIYELGNGKKVYMSLERYLSMDDSEFQMLVSLGTGCNYEDNYSENDDTPLDIIVIEESIIIDDSDNYKELQDIGFEEKISDKDFINEDE